jgi:hypothetical protein
MIVPSLSAWASCRSSSAATSKRRSLDEHKVEDSLKRGAAHDSRAVGDQQMTPDKENVLVIMVLGSGKGWQ